MHRMIPEFTWSFGWPSNKGVFGPTADSFHMGKCSLEKFPLAPLISKSDEHLISLDRIAP